MKLETTRNHAMWEPPSEYQSCSYNGWGGITKPIWFKKQWVEESIMRIGTKYKILLPDIPSLAIRRERNNEWLGKRTRWSWKNLRSQIGEEDYNTMEHTATPELLESQTSGTFYQWGYMLTCDMIRCFFHRANRQSVNYQCLVWCTNLLCQHRTQKNMG